MMQEDTKKAQVFLKIEDYKDIVDVSGIIKEKINDIDGALNRIKYIKSKEDSELASWKASLERTRKKIDDIDKELLKPDLS